MVGVVVIRAIVEMAEIPMFDGVLAVGFDGQLVLEVKEKLVQSFCVFKL